MNLQDKCCTQGDRPNKWWGLKVEQPVILSFYLRKRISWGAKNDVVSVRVAEETLSKDNLSTKDPLQKCGYKGVIEACAGSELWLRGRQGVPTGRLKRWEGGHPEGSPNWSSDLPRFPAAPGASTGRGLGTWCPDLMPLLLLISSRAPEGSSPGSPKSLGAFDSIPSRTQLKRLSSSSSNYKSDSQPGEQVESGVNLGDNGRWLVQGVLKNWRYIPRKRKIRITWIIPESAPKAKGEELSGHRFLSCNSMRRESF